MSQERLFGKFQSWMKWKRCECGQWMSHSEKKCFWCLNYETAMKEEKQLINNAKKAEKSEARPISSFATNKIDSCYGL
jgi:hypothetical protein